MLQQNVFKDLGQGVLDNAWEGYNAALFAYGQTGSGKSYSMIGYGANKGIVPITCGELFKAFEKNKDEDREFQVIPPHICSGFLSPGLPVLLFFLFFLPD